MRTAPSLLSAIVATLLLGCSETTGPSDGPAIRAPQAPEAVFRVSPSIATLRHGGILQLTTTYSADPAFSTGASSVSWHSSNESVATVSPSGVVRGVSGGQARIVASRGGYQASALVTVTGAMKKHDGSLVCLRRAPSAEHGQSLC
jgi:hypothetical protein